jgi:hypothetical protein
MVETTKLKKKSTMTISKDSKASICKDSHCKAETLYSLLRVVELAFHVYLCEKVNECTRVDLISPVFEWGMKNKERTTMLSWLIHSSPLLDTTLYSSTTVRVERIMAVELWG